MTTTDPPFDPARPACGEAIAVLQEFLDGTPTAEPPAVRAHRDGCQACREEWLLAKLMTARPQAAVTVPAGLTEKTERGVRRDRTRRRIQRWAAATLIPTAAVVLAIVFRPGQPPASTTNPVIASVASAGDETSNAPSFNASLADARAAVASLGDRLTTPPEVKWPSLPLPKVEPTADAEPAWDRLANAGDGLKTGVRPITNSARRAVTMLFRATETLSTTDAPRRN